MPASGDRSVNGAFSFGPSASLGGVDTAGNPLSTECLTNVIAPSGNVIKKDLHFFEVYGKVLYTNPSWSAIVARPTEQTLSLTRLDGIHPDDLEHVRLAIVEMLKQKVETNQVAGIKRKRRDGEVGVLQPGFRIPFVGAPVSASLPDLVPLVPPEFTSDTSPVPPLDRSESVSRVKIEDRSDDPISEKKRQKQKLLPLFNTPQKICRASKSHTS